MDRNSLSAPVSPSNSRTTITAPNSSERTPLLRSKTTDSNTVEWASTLKRKSALFSDVISGRTHSGWDLNDGDIEEEPILNSHNHNSNNNNKNFKNLKAGYDGEFREELQGENGNGVRQWYENYTSIDFLHDSIKHSIRTKKLRGRMNEGIRGLLANLIDGLQGWILVTLVGLFTALVAYFIISSEMLLFDLKEGYCSENFRLAKRFCCKATQVVPSLNGDLSPFMQGWTMTSSLESSCESWRTWGEVWNDHRASGSGGEGDDWFIDYAAFIAIAVLLSTTASTMTIYLSSSTSVYSSKDSASVPYAGLSPDYPASRFVRTPTIEYGSSTSFEDDNDIDDRASFFAPKPQDPPMVIPSPRPRKVLYFASGSGIPEIKTILSGFVIRGYLGSFTLATKSIGLALSVASGLSLGKEGPLVHIASCVGNIMSRFFPKFDRNEARRREIISAACAAGVAVSFGAPVGGTLFSLEEVSYFFPPRVMFRSFFCAMVAALTLKYLDPFGTGKIVLFQVSYDRDWHSYELISFTLLGVFGGAYGALFCKANIWYTRTIRNGSFLKYHPIIEVASITILTVLISFRSSFLSLGGTELVFELFSECQSDSVGGLCTKSPDLAWGLVSSLFIALLLKALLTVATFGIKLPAGIFIPTLAVGALAGRIFGLLIELWHSSNPEVFLFDGCSNSEGFGQACVLPGLYAMIGATAALAGVTRTTVSLAVIMFELTGTLSYTVPVMISILVSKTVADAIEPRSIYDLVIELSDLPYLDVKTEYLHELSLQDILHSDAAVINLDNHNTLASLSDQLTKLYGAASGSGFPIVARDPQDNGLRMFGYISSKELEHGLASASNSSPKTKCTFNSSQAVRSGLNPPATSHSSSTPSGTIDFSWLVEMTPLILNHNSPMELAHELFSKLGCRFLIIVDERGLYSGIIEKNRYLAYLRWLEKTKRENKWKKPSTSSSHA